MKKAVIVLLFILVLLPNYVFANSISNTYTNLNGVDIPMDMYHNLQKLHTNEYIDVLTDDEYNRLANMNIDFSTAKRTEKYIKSEYNNVTGRAVHTEISKEEYDAVDVSAYLERPRATLIETAYKKLALAFVKTSYDTTYSTLSAIWKVLPVTRSFDVNAQRLYNLEYVNGTQQGKQIYHQNGVAHTIQYDFDNDRTKNFNTGFGISMNLVDTNNLTYLESETDTSAFITNYPCAVFAAYEHATQNVTLTQSQYYTLGPGGQGGVIVFYNNMGAKYDNMTGVYDYFTS